MGVRRVVPAHGRPMACSGRTKWGMAPAASEFGKRPVRAGALGGGRILTLRLRLGERSDGNHRPPAAALELVDWERPAEVESLRVGEAQFDAHHGLLACLDTLG